MIQPPIYLCPVGDNAQLKEIALATLNNLGKKYAKIAVFRPVTSNEDMLLSQLKEHLPAGGVIDSGVSLKDYVSNEHKALTTIISKFNDLASQNDITLVIGGETSPVIKAAELEINLNIAANIAANMVLIIPSATDCAETQLAIQLALSATKKHHVRVIAAFFTGTDSDQTVLCPIKIFDSKTVAEQCAITTELQLKCLSGKELPADISNLLLADKGLTQTIKCLKPDSLVVAAHEGTEFLLALVIGAKTGSLTLPAAVVLTENIDEKIVQLCKKFIPQLPVFYSDKPTSQVVASFNNETRDYKELCFSKDLAYEKLIDLNIGRSKVITPRRFEAELLAKAQKVYRHIVLPEGEEKRILLAAQQIVANKTCKISLLGNENIIRANAKELGLSLPGVDIIDPRTSSLQDSFAQEYATLRAKKGVTLAQAKDQIVDVSYFGTMMVLTGLADGMVSGAVNTTAHTIRPALQVIKTKPGVSVVSSVLFMCLADKVLAYGDCAVNPNPTAEQLADIAISSAATVKAFDIEPRVALLSYSTGISGKGPDVDLVKEATDIAKQKAPSLLIDGPLQYDAAVDATVAAQKCPDSMVAGRATVLIFPDLSAGNNAYKAVQRSSNALAIGPVLQGLNKPINDLSRGALVEDIVNTIAITAIQSTISI